LFSPSASHHSAVSPIITADETAAANYGLLWGAPVVWFENVHSRAIVALLLGAVAAQTCIADFDLLQHPICAAALIMFLGVPHGSFDITLLQQRYPTSRLSDLLLRYVALAGLVLIVWSQFPGLALSGFLLIAAYHFGGDWPTTGKMERFSLGATLLSATTVQHGDQVALIFTWLATDDVAVQLVSVMRLLAAVLLVMVPVLIWQGSPGHYGRKIEICVVIGAALVLPPITFFVIYFCLLHSIRHLISVHVALSNHSRRDLLTGAAPYAAAALVGSATGAALLSHLNLGAASISAVFLSLAALTVPHMLLVDDH
jgi:beta-carotene 15,15'-dioxygenase